MESTKNNGRSAHSGTDSLRQRHERNVLRGLVQRPLDTWPAASILRAADFKHYPGAFETIAFLIIDYLRDNKRPVMLEAVLSDDIGIGADLAADLFEVAHESTFTEGLSVVLGRLPTNAESIRIGKTANLCERIAENIAGIATESGGESDPDFDFIDSVEFASRTYEDKWLVEYFLKAHQPCILAGPSKCLKTTLLVELAISLSTGRDLLEEFKSTPQRVAFISAESGEETLQETAIRICRSKGIELSGLSDNLFWRFRPAQISEVSHIESLRAFILRNKITVLMIDPAYLSMGIGDDAKNQFLVGAVLQKLTALQADTGATVILAAHTNKNIAPGTELTLSHIAYAGFGQWARQWILINRKKEYDPTQAGIHKLIMSFGGSAGHVGAVVLDIDEGTIEEGRKWDYAVRSKEEVDAENACKDDEFTELAMKSKAQALQESNKKKILDAMRRCPDAQSESDIRDGAGLGGKVFKPIWNSLLDGGKVVEFGTIKKKNRQTYPGYKLSDSA